MRDFFALLAHPMAILGLMGQACFFMRFMVQWLVSEKRKESVVPVVFWYLSLAGGLLVLIYAIWRKDPVFVLGQSVGFIVYIRNLMLIHRRRGRHELV